MTDGGADRITLYFLERISLLTWLDSISWTLLIIACLTLGLAPFVPEPHVWEKLKMLAAGSLVRPIDIFDLLLHALPWFLLSLKAIRQLLR